MNKIYDKLRNSNKVFYFTNDQPVLFVKYNSIKEYAYLLYLFDKLNLFENRPLSDFIEGTNFNIKIIDIWLNKDIPYIMGEEWHALQSNVIREVNAITLSDFLEITFEEKNIENIFRI